MRWLVTGATGMLGSEVCQQLRRRDEDTIAVGHSELDITRRDAVLALCGRVWPDVVVNCAAFTKVDRCETDEDLAELVNAMAVGHLAEAVNAHDALLVQISTDFVFDGSKASEWDVDDLTHPLSAYGRTKLHGEEYAANALRHLIVRTSWVFGANGPNFVEAILGQIERGNRALRIVDDQKGKPTWTPHLASALIDLAERNAVDDSVRGIFHYADAPACTWFDFAREVVRLRIAMGGGDGAIEISPVSTAEFPRPAVRPANSALSTARYEAVTGNAPGSWLEGLEEYLRHRELDHDPIA